MSKHSPNSKSEFIEERRKLLYWIARWTDEEAHFDNINLDLPEMSIMLQSMGFRLETFEKALDGENVQITSNMADKNMMKVELTCPKSGMRSTMIKQTPSCKCPSEEEVEKGQFWCVTGCGPSSQNSINTSNSSLLPTITPAKIKIIKGLLFQVFKVINGAEVNENGETLPPVIENASLTRHRSLDTLRNSEEAAFVSRGLKRGSSWEVDPKTSPPTQTSSPVPNLCATMSRVSINSEESDVMVRNLKSIKKLVDETLDIAAGNNATFIKSSVPRKRVSDIKPTEGPSVGDLIRHSTLRTTPRRVLTPKKNRVTPREKKEVVAAPSKIAMFRKKTLISAVSPSAGKLLRKDTLRPSANLLKQSVPTSGSCESIFKSKLAASVGVKPGLSPRVAKGNEAGTSGISRFKSVGKLTLNAVTPAKKKS